MVTGLDQSQFPSRISFSVASSIDSRVILDTVGADRCLGMEICSSYRQTPRAARLQGVMVSDQEVERVITFWQKTWDEEEPTDRLLPGRRC